MPRPTFQKSRGPNGRHLAPLSPYPDDAGLVTTTIKPSGGLAFGLRDYTPKDFQDGWDIVNAKAGESGWGMVLMEEGNIRGYGGGAGYDPALSGIGGVRKNRILFWPKKGWGSVSFVGSSVKIHNPRGWTLAGVRGGANHELGLLVVAAENFGVWRSTAQYLNSVGSNGMSSTACDFVECAIPNSWVWETDSAANRGADITEKKPLPGPISGTNYIACYIAPTWRPSGSSSHTDSLQWSGDSAYGDSTVEDTVIFSSTNHGIIIGGTATKITIRNTAVIGAQVGPKRHPVTGIAPANSKFAGKGPGLYNSPIALNGAGAPGQVKIYDSIFIGPIKNIGNLSKPGAVIENVRVTSSDAKAGDSRFTLDESMNNWTLADLDREFPHPSDARLSVIWAVDAKFPTDPENPEEPEEPENPETPAGVLTQDVMPSLAQAWALASAPELSYSTTPTVVGVSVTPTDAKVAHTGPAATALVPSSVAGYYRPNFLADILGAGSSTNPRFMPPYGTKIRTSSPVVEIALQQRPDLTGGGITTRTPIRIKVDGQWTSRTPIFLGPDGNMGYDGITPSFISAGTKFWLKLTFPSAADREIEIQSMLEYAGWSVPAGESFGTAKPPKHTVVWDMDSLAAGEKHGTGNYSLSGTEGGLQKATYTALSSAVYYASQTLGYDSIINSSAGSSGYNINGDTVKYIDEQRNDFDVIAHDPQLVVVGTGLNDVQAGQSAAQVQANATNVLNQIKAGVPDAIRVVLGIPSIPKAAEFGGATAIVPFNTGLKAAAQATGAWFLDPILGDLFNPAGVRVADKPNMVTGNETKFSSDKTHPTQAGAEFFGTGYFADMLRLVHPPVGTGGPVEPPVDDSDPVLEWVTDNADPLPATAILVVNASHSSGIESVKFFATVNGQSVALPGVSKGAGDNWVLTFDTTKVANGSYIVKAIAKAVNGNEAEEPRTFVVANGSVVPNKPPVVTPLDPPADTVLPRTGQIVFRGRATDDRLIERASFRLRIDGVLGDPRTASIGVLGNGVYELPVDPSTILGLDGYLFQATDTGEPPLTAATGIVPVAIAPEIDHTPLGDFTLTVTATGPGELTAEWTESVDVADQYVLYRAILDGQRVGDSQADRIRVFSGLTPGAKPSIRIVAFDPDENETSSNEVADVTVLGQPTVTLLGKPTLEVKDVTPTSAGLVGAAPADTTGIVGYELKRGDTVLKRADTIAEFAYVRVELEQLTDYRYTLESVGEGETRSDPAVVAFRTPAKPQTEIAPGWFITGPREVLGSAGPVNGRVLVRYSSDVRTTNGRQLTPTQQVVNAVNGRFYDPATGDLWQGYRSANPKDTIEWIEQFIGPDGRRAERPRRFRFPADTTSAEIDYLDRIWLEDAPTGASLPVWAQELDTKVAAVQAAAVRAEIAAGQAAEFRVSISNDPDGFVTVTIGGLDG